MKELNPGIVRMVALLNEAGFDTCDSGDGETHDFECDRDVGYVVVLLRPEQPLEETARAVAGLLIEHGIDFRDPEHGPSIQASYGPIDGYRIIDVHNVHDRMLKTP